MYAKFFTIAALVSAVVAVPSVLGQGYGCTTGSVQCCQRVGSSSDITQHVEGLPNAASLIGQIMQGGVMNDVKSLVGFQCTPVTGQGASGVSCSAQAACCDEPISNAIISFNCSPINING
ncbi:hypothetical protein Ac2012v2_005247 [Leucoagaricus gongylophorus]